MKKVLALGEILLRLSPSMNQTLTQANKLDCQFGGSELNVLATLAQLGYPVEIMSAIPDNALGKMTEHFLFSRQIGQKNIIKQGRRLGLYYYQKGFSLRASQVTYDRDYSSFYESKLSDYDLEKAFENVGWFHVSGITAALTPDVYQLTMETMKFAKRKKIPVSFDLNYRATLWDSFQQAREMLSPFVKLADVCIGIEPIQLLSESGKDFKDERCLTRPYEDKELLEEIVSKLSKEYEVQSIAFTQREMDHTNEYKLKAYFYHDNKLYETSKESIQVLDRVGTGDAFTAGIIYGLLENKTAQKILDIAMASFKFKHTIEGDINIITREDIEQMLNNASHEISR